MTIPKEDKRDYLRYRIAFINISKDANKIFKEFNIRLNFEGFTETLQTYALSDSSNVFELKELIVDLNYWLYYFGQIQTIVDFYEKYFEILCEKEDDEATYKKLKQNAFILRNYAKSINKYKTRFKNARNDCSERIIEAYKSYGRDSY